MTGYGSVMTYVEIWAAAAHGGHQQRVRRAAWNKGETIRWEANRSSVNGVTYTPLWYAPGKKGGEEPWIPSQHDLEAEDWELVK